MTKYVVKSRVVPEEGEPFDQVETSRTDYKVAAEDRAIVQDILRRKAWIEEVS
jgi:hypothetical protein